MNTSPEETSNYKSEPRKLATIAKIEAIEDISFTNENGIEEIAQNIVKAKVRGWSVVTQWSNNFTPGSLCVYFEIDSVLPADNPEFAFLEKYKYRLRTIKLKGQISQGLILPISILEHLPNCPGKIEDLAGNLYFVPDKTPDVHIPIFEGHDFTETIGVVKYEPPIPANLRGQVKGLFPHFLRKTDEERIQNAEWLLEKYKGKEFYATEKLDGSSFTCYRKDGVFGVCSRNLELTETADNAYWQLARRLQIEEKMIELGLDNVCIQGEMIGPGIQKNRYGLKQVELYIFDAFDIETQEYTRPATGRVCMRDITELGIPWVEDVWDGILNFTLEEVLAMADGPSFLNPDVMREGIVFRPEDETRDPKFGRVSFKAISNAYLLKHGE